jgi:hypothetical protein
VSNILGSEPQMKIMDYCMVTVCGFRAMPISVPR